MATSSYTGVDGSAVDQSSSATGTTANASTTTPATTGYNQLVIGAYFDDGNADATLTRGGDFNLRGALVNNANTEIILEDKNSSQPEAVTAKVVSAAGNWGMLCVVYQNSTLPTRAGTLINAYNSVQYAQDGADDGDYFIAYGSENMIQNYQRANTNNTDTPTFSWRGRTTYDTRVSPFIIQIYNVNSAAWETLCVQNKAPADTDFILTDSQTTNVSNYYDSNNIVTFRVYQKVI